jgi:hypothetical protein
MLSSKVICDDTYSNKSWAIVGQGFYELRDVNLMEREMIHYLSFDLTITGAELEKFTGSVRQTYKRGVPKTAYVVVPDKSRENDYFGKGTLEIEMKPSAAVVPALSKKSSVPIDPPPSYSSAIVPPVPISIPIHTVPALTSPESEDSPYSDSSSSSRSSSPGCLKTPTDDGTIGASNRPAHIPASIAGVGKPIIIRAAAAALGGGDIMPIRIGGTDSNYASPSGW